MGNGKSSQKTAMAQTASDTKVYTSTNGKYVVNKIDVNYHMAPHKIAKMLEGSPALKKKHSWLSCPKKDWSPRQTDKWNAAIGKVQEWADKLYETMTKTNLNTPFGYVDATLDERRKAKAYNKPLKGYCEICHGPYLPAWYFDLTVEEVGIECYEDAYKKYMQNHVKNKESIECHVTAEIWRSYYHQWKGFPNRPGFVGSYAEIKASDSRQLDSITLRGGESNVRTKPKFVRTATGAIPAAARRVREVPGVDTDDKSNSDDDTYEEPKEAEGAYEPEKFVRPPTWKNKKSSTNTPAEEPEEVSEPVLKPPSTCKKTSSTNTPAEELEVLDLEPALRPPSTRPTNGPPRMSLERLRSAVSSHKTEENDKPHVKPPAIPKPSWGRQSTANTGEPKPDGPPKPTWNCDATANTPSNDSGSSSTCNDKHSTQPQGGSDI